MSVAAVKLPDSEYDSNDSRQLMKGRSHVLFCQKRSGNWLVRLIKVCKEYDYPIIISFGCVLLEAEIWKNNSGAQ